MASHLQGGKGSKLSPARRKDTQWHDSHIVHFLVDNYPPISGSVVLSYFSSCKYSVSILIKLGRFDRGTITAHCCRLKPGVYLFRISLDTLCFTHRLPALCSAYSPTSQVHHFVWQDTGNKMSFSRGEPLSLNELKFISSALCENHRRVDGRGIYDFRTLKLSFGSEYGQVQVQLGTTRVYVVTTCEVTAPNPDKPSDGFFTFNVQFSSISSLEYESGR